MPELITGEQVKRIIKTDIDDIDLFIDTAEDLANEELANKGLSERRFLKIIIYLSAHFLTLKERQVAMEKLGDASNTYQGATGMYLDSSLYGQTALVLDTSGTLKTLGQHRVSVELLCN